MKMWYFHAVELYSALKKVEIMTILGKKKKKVGLEVIKVSELAHIENANSTFSLWYVDLWFNLGYLLKAEN